ncbi:MAG TPA: STAS domain-containing protein [Phenylobacterium sp.]|jgi:anti-sigma B factor antagonist|nr:STAS domain-containing protein [Phenylobacterium sp.]
MDWELERSAAHLVGRPRGRVDETTWEAFSDALTAAVREAAGAGGVPLVIDLSGLDYMSSRGLRALTMAKREAGDTVKITLAAPNDRMREILAISRYDKLFDVTDEAPPAVAASGGPDA